MQTNRLAQETSPYLQQHQHNPVDWYPWGEEAFDAARRQDKPIFLSVGYSTCYWCHVMERQSFENIAIARHMNEDFICIKVDREERPDVDQLYMTAVQVMTRQGGWPMSVWLLPDLRPFFGGTYFAPFDSADCAGFPRVLEALAEAYDKQRFDITESAEKITDVLRELASPPAPDQPMVYSTQWLEGIINDSIADYEPKHGGFGRAPKFPRQTLLELLLHWINYQRATGFDVDRIAKPLRHTLDAMANGGIRDHLGGAFHRYSTDKEWLVPHFEIMLYDNAMLGWIYAEASRVFNEPRYESVARGIFDFVLNEMTSPDGAFYTAFDAEVDAQEGLNYLWTAAEVAEVLTAEEGALFNDVYGINLGPNFSDPHHGTGMPDKNVLFLPNGPAQESEPAIIAMREKLYAKRRERKLPLLDTKIITSWNALMIRAFAHAGDLFGDATYLEAARRATHFLLQVHRASDGGFFRTSRDGVQKYHAFLDDYAFVAQALVELHRITRDPFCLDEARKVIEAMRSRFEDVEKGGFFFTDSSHTDLIVRQKVGNDSPLPAGNAIAALVCDAVGETESASRALAAFASQTQHHAASMSTQVMAILQFVQNHGELHIAPGAAGSFSVEAPQDQAVRLVEIGHGWKGDRQIMVELKIADGYHLSAQTSLESMSELIENIEVPAAVSKTFAYVESPVLVLEGTVRVLVTLRQIPAPGSTIPLRLSYQVCSDTACLPVVTRGISVVR